MPAPHTKRSSTLGLHDKVRNNKLKILVCMISISMVACISLWAAAPPDTKAKVETTLPMQHILKDTTLVDTHTPEYVILQPIDEVTFSSETTASIEKLPVKEGSYFKAGDILLELDCRVQKAELDKAIAQQTASDIALKSAIKLKSYDSISEYEVVKAKADAAMVNADVSKLRAIVDKCIIKAPFNGAVAVLKVHSHETVRPGDPLIRIVNTDR